MVVVMAPEATDEDVAAIVTRVVSAGGEAFVSRGVSRTIIGLVGDVDLFASLELRVMPGVADVIRVSAPYKLVSRQHHPTMTTVYVGPDRVPIGPDTFTLIAGPCAVEDHAQTLAAAQPIATDRLEAMMTIDSAIMMVWLPPAISVGSASCSTRITAHRASAIRCIWPPSCSTYAPARNCCTCPTRAWRPR